MAKEPELKVRDKVVVRMTREGAVEENLTAGTEQRVSKRLEDAELVKPVETAAPSEVPSSEEQKKVQMRRQQRQFQAEHAEDIGSSISTPSEDPPIKRKEFFMNPKYQKVLSDIEKAEKKKSEIEGQLKELYDKKTELENLEIINTVRSMVMDKDQIMAFLSSMKGGTKPAENTEVIDNA